MTWPEDLGALAKWAIQVEDLRHRFLYAGRAADLERTQGISKALEVSVVLAIYEAALAKRYIAEKTVDYERDYPGQSGKNPQRADLAFKDPGKGKNWAYVEVKYYGDADRRKIAADIDKLRSIKQRSQRWILCYRVRPRISERKQKGTKRLKLEQLLRKNFPRDLKVAVTKSVSTIGEESQFAVCDIVLARDIS